jgi:hypothetical protein
VSGSHGPGVGLGKGVAVGVGVSSVVGVAVVVSVGLVKVGGIFSVGALSIAVDVFMGWGITVFSVGFVPQLVIVNARRIDKMINLRMDFSPG